MLTSKITWQPATNPPDEETTVLIAIRSCTVGGLDIEGEPVWLGFIVEGQWRTVLP